MADTVDKPKTRRIELLFTHCWNGYADLPFATKGPEVQALKGQKVKEIKWLKEELADTEDEDLNEWTLENLNLGGFDGDDEVVVWVTLKEAACQ